MVSPTRRFHICVSVLIYANKEQHKSKSTLIGTFWTSNTWKLLGLNNQGQATPNCVEFQMAKAWKYLMHYVRYPLLACHSPCVLHAGL